MAELYQGIRVLEISKDIIDLLYKDKVIEIWDKRLVLHQNEYLVLKDETGEQSSALAKVKGGNIVLLPSSISASGIKNKNKEQLFAMDALLDSSIECVALTGRAGVGKSLLAISAALELIDKKKYQKIIICKSMTQLGNKNELGYLPGPQPLDAKILTPTGWKLMGNLRVGDEVIARDGKPAKILNIYPKGMKDVYNITTSEDESTECCADHLWLTQTYEDIKRGNRPGSIKTTADIKETLTKNLNWREKNVLNHYLPRNEVVNFTTQEISLPAYTLGTILGDGHIGESISLINMDKEIIERVNNEIQKMGCNLTHVQNTISYNLKGNIINNKPARPIILTNIKTGEIKTFSRIEEAVKSLSLTRNNLNYWCSNCKIVNNWKYEFQACPIQWSNPIKQKLYELGLEDTRAWEKFIPDVYKYNSVNVRLDLLRGLMDTDGTIKESGEASYTTTSLQLANDIVEIVKSLGGRARICKRNRVGKSSHYNPTGQTIITRRVSYEFTISMPTNLNPFYISRKAQYHREINIYSSRIQSIEKVGQKEVQCILIDNPEHLYITNDYIVTHNTIDEKFNIFNQGMLCNMGMLSGGKAKSQDLIEQYDITFLPLAVVRGSSWGEGTIVISDELQNLTKFELLSLGTRMGTGSKLVLLADFSQTDFKMKAKDCGLFHFINNEAVKSSSLVASINLIKVERGMLSQLFSEVFEEKEEK